MDEETSALRTIVQDQQYRIKVLEAERERLQYGIIQGERERADLLRVLGDLRGRVEDLENST